MSSSTRDDRTTTFSKEDMIKMLWGAVASAGRSPPFHNAHRWAYLSESLGIGSTWARRLCREMGFDPDEIVGTGADAESEEE